MENSAGSSPIRAAASALACSSRGAAGGRGCRRV
ncbi:Uncharacterised protein [Bordetella pertussis]|nr:Uncharacterised protein [Bordetella pertussis]